MSSSLQNSVTLTISPTEQASEYTKKALHVPLHCCSIITVKATTLLLKLIGDFN